MLVSVTYYVGAYLYATLPYKKIESEILRPYVLLYLMLASNAAILSNITRITLKLSVNS